MLRHRFGGLLLTLGTALTACLHTALRPLASVPGMSAAEYVMD
jgi:hypothetical protein